MSNYPPGVYDCGKCGEVVGGYHECGFINSKIWEVYYSKDGGIKWFICEDHDNKDRALEVAEELIQDGFDSMVVDHSQNIIFDSTQKKGVA